MRRCTSKVKANSIENTPICLIDIMATVAEIAGVDLADNSAEDSVSFLPALEEKAFKRDSIINHSIQGKFALRSGDWKLVFCPGSGGWSAPKDNEAKKAKFRHPDSVKRSQDAFC